ncbi:hypothetical protein [Nocardia fluminea]|uniref:DNA-directed RNA polymerase specialized sigma24 family protein n=1 Tax=Nocardia fluminea TaxID=134984 RepID=A0A2N3VLS0_9NOCA|nr:hypothetical protein [Nocardia fluminea]PKV82561.1 hypothetical protein ATK86_7051 [Nocardia fluminea]
MTNSEWDEYPESSESGATPLAVVRSSFDRIAAQPLPTHPRPVPTTGPPEEPVRSWEQVRDRLRDPAVGFAEVDAIWGWLIERSRLFGNDATLVCACLAEPILAKTATRFATSSHAERDDIESEILAGFFAHLTRVDLDRPWVLFRLRWAVYRAAATVHRQESGVISVADIAADLGPIGDYARLMVSQPGHPEIVLAHAITAGVITEKAAELIAVSRWERRSLTSLADEREESVWALRKRRRRAERRLLAWMTERAQDAPGTTSTVEAHAQIALDRTDARSLPRRGRRPEQDSPAPAPSSTEHERVAA